MKNILLPLILTFYFSANNAMDSRCTRVTVRTFIGLMKALKSTPEEINEEFSQEQQYKLLILADKFQYNYLYASLIKILLGTEIDNTIAKKTFSMNTLKNTVIKNSTQQTCTTIPFYTTPIIKTNFNDAGTYYFARTKSKKKHNMITHHSYLWKTSTDDLVKEFCNNDYEIIQLNPVHNVIALGAKKKSVVACSRLQLYDILTGKFTSLPARCPVSSITFSPDGHYMAVVLGKNIDLWIVNNKDNYQKKELIGHTSAIDALSFNSQSTLLVSGSPEIENCAIVWHIDNLDTLVHKIILTGQHRHFKNFTFSDNSCTIFAQTNTPCSLLFTFREERWLHQQIATNHGKRSTIAHNKDTGLLLARSGCNFTLYDDQGKEIKKLSSFDDTPILSAALSKNGRNLLIAKKADSSSVNFIMHELCDEKTEDCLNAMEKTITSAQALLLHTLCLHHQKNTVSKMAKACFDAHSMRLFTPEQHQMLQQQL